MRNHIHLAIAVSVSALCSGPWAVGADVAPSAISLLQWKTEPAPIYFKYGGKESPNFLPTWKREETVSASDGGQVHRFIFRDPAAKLRVTAEVRTFTDYDAVEWVLNFANEGTSDTPIIEDIQPLHYSIPIEQKMALVHWARGGNGGFDDFEPQVNESGLGNTFKMKSRVGRSSNDMLPFFNVQDGDKGVIGAIGWSGNWKADFVRDRVGKTLDVSAGMQKTHFVLHPGETVRTPRILMLNWRGDIVDAHNLWRRLLLAHYSPRDTQGKVVTGPISLGTWGTELIDSKLALLRSLSEQKVPLDVYWVDAGWYGNEGPKPGKTLDPNSPWDKHRGNWWPSKQCYPQGLKPLGEGVRKAGLGFLLWFDAEVADPGSTIRTEHPDWFLALKEDEPALLDLGNPAARKGITDLISNTISETGMKWYRQDSNINPEKYWASADVPNRVGITEIRHVEGLYQFWDELRARHPDLQIDNCCSGGRRLDLEAISRSMALWRSDMTCAPFDPIAEQMHTQAIMPWVPLTAGVVSLTSAVHGEPARIYALRSGYGAAMDYGSDLPPDNWMKEAVEEAREVRPFFYGDFYPMLSYTALMERKIVVDAWSAWQLHRPDLKAGVAIVLRRQKSPFPSMDLNLHAIDPEAHYEVEIRSGFGKGSVQNLTGEKLKNLSVNIPDKPGSVLVFYRRQ